MGGEDREDREESGKQEAGRGKRLKTKD